MKKKLLKTTTLGLTLAMALAAAGCGSSKNDGGKSPANDKQTSTNNGSVDAGSGDKESADTDNSNDIDTANIDFKDCPWFMGHELSDAEYLELPEGATLYGETLPITPDTLKSLPLHASGKKPLTDCLDYDAYGVTFFADGLEYPSLEMDAHEETVDVALNNMKWYLSDGYLNNLSFRISDDDFSALKQEHSDISDEYLLIDLLEAQFGSPNYISYFDESPDAVTLIDDFLHPECSEYNFSHEAMYVGWQFEEFGIQVMYFETVQVDNSTTSGFYSEVSNNVGLAYVPIENGTLAEFNHDEDFSADSGKNIVKDVIAEKQRIFGDAEFLKPDASLLK